MVKDKIRHLTILLYCVVVLDPLYIFQKKNKVIFILEDSSSIERTTGSVVQTDDG